MTAIADRRALVAAVHDAPAKLVLAVTGGGNAAITDLLDVPGASRTVLEIVVPYAEPALQELLAGGRPGPSPSANHRADVDLAAAGAVSATTAEAMSVACLDRARHLAGEDGPLLGVACTAALVSDRPKRGDHRAHIAVASADGVAHRRVELDKGALDRPGEDRVVADAVLTAIADACGVLAAGSTGPHAQP